jgi:IS5 family transposase
VESKISHSKSDNRLGRCFLQGLSGDTINAVLYAAGSNQRKLLNGLSFALTCWLRLRFTF